MTRKPRGRRAGSDETLWAGGTPAFDERTGRTRRAPGRRPDSRLRPEVFRLGFSTAGLPGLPVGEAVRRVARGGFDGVELDCRPGAAGAPEALDAPARRALQRRCSDLGLALPALRLALDGLAEDPCDEALVRAIALAHDLARGAPPVLVTPAGGQPGQWETDRDRLVEAVYRWAAEASRAQVTLALLPEVAGAVQTPAQARWLFRRIGLPGLRLAYDERPFQAQGLPFNESLRTLAPDAAIVHLPEVGETGSAGGLPATGAFDGPTWLEWLHDAGYRGYLIAGVAGPAAADEAAVRRCREGLDRALAQAGERLAGR